MRSPKWTFILLLSALLCLVLLPAPSLATENGEMEGISLRGAAAQTTTGSCGDNLTWSFDESTGTLTITGTGAMGDYADASAVPWASVKDQIKSVSLPSGLTSIGKFAFTGLTGLTSIVIPDSVTSIGDSAFVGCTELTDVYYQGTVRQKAAISFASDNECLQNATWHCLKADSVEMKSLPSKCAYDEAATLGTPDVTDGLLLACYSNGINEEIPLTVEMVTGFDDTKTGVQTLTVTFEDASTTFEVTVNHVPGNPVQENVVEATCTEAGSYDEVVYCTVCNDVLSREAKTIDALGHEEVIDEAVDATCTEAGLTEGKHCARCNEVLVAQEVVPALGHTVINDEAVDPTCEEPGWTAGQRCAVCGQVLVHREAVGEPLGHELEHREAKAPTCTEVGWAAYDVCTREGCDYTTYTELPALGHTPGEPVRENEGENSCTEGGSYDEVVYCTVCGEELSRETKTTVEALGHDLVHHEARAATCAEAGWEEYDTCSRCGYTTYIEIPALGHEEVIDEAVDATCTEAGLTEGKHCARCNEVLVAQEVVPALGHTVINDEAVGPTCEEPGWTAGQHCASCGKVLIAQETLPALGSHDLIYHEAQEPTCTEAGWGGLRHLLPV